MEMGLFVPLLPLPIPFWATVFGAEPIGPKNSVSCVFVNLVQCYYNTFSALVCFALCVCVCIVVFSNFHLNLCVVGLCLCCWYNPHQNLHNKAKRWNDDAQNVNRFRDAARSAILSTQKLYTVADSSASRSEMPQWKCIRDSNASDLNAPTNWERQMIWVIAFGNRNPTRPNASRRTDLVKNGGGSHCRTTKRMSKILYRRRWWPPNKSALAKNNKLVWGCIVIWVENNM